MTPDTIPEDVPTATFDDERNDLAHWYQTLRELDVPTPASRPLELEPTDDGPPEWDTDRAVEIVSDLGGEAFLRSGYKSAQMELGRGSHVRSAHPEQVDTTIKELLSQHVMMRVPVGEALWLREWLPVDWCRYCRENLVPELRAFVRDGEVVCYHPRLEGFDRAPEHHREHAVGLVESGWDGEHRDVTVREYAERVAEAFEGCWSVDFVLTTDGDWYCTDMAVDALYDATDRGGDGWRNVSEHPGDCEHDWERHVDDTEATA